MSQIGRGKFEREDFSSLSLRGKVDIMTGYVNAINYFGKNVKACSQIYLFTPFGLQMVLCS